MLVAPPGRGGMPGGQPYGGSLHNALEAFEDPQRYPEEGRPSKATLLAMITPEACRKKERHGYTPLHWAATRAPPVSVVAKLIEVAGPEYLMAKRDRVRGRTPLHNFAYYSKSEASVALVIAANPEALKAKDDVGKTPYDLTIWSASCSQECREMLASAETAEGLTRILGLAEEVKTQPEVAKAIAEGRAIAGTLTRLHRLFRRRLLRLFGCGSTVTL